VNHEDLLSLSQKDQPDNSRAGLLPSFRMFRREPVAEIAFRQLLGELEISVYLLADFIAPYGSAGNDLLDWQNCIPVGSSIKDRQVFERGQKTIL
jgi:hypothetical protein